MPQKRNPDAAELVRGKAGRMIGHLNALLTMMKGLSLTYSKDMQEDKEPVFDAADSLSLAVAAMSGMVSDMEVDPDALEAALADGFPTATDLADWLVRVLAMPFRRAHHVTGRIVALAEERGCSLADLPLDAMQQVEAGISKDIYNVLSNEASVNSRTSFGGTAPARVKAAAKAARERYL
jgi:argininosuccinate lyase